MRKFLTAFFIASSLVVSFSAFTPLVAHAAPAAPAAKPLDPVAGAAAEKTAQQPDPGLLDSAMSGVMSTLMMLFAWLLGVAAITLDNAVYYTVVTMGGVVNDLSAIGVAWRILRDIGNIILIFGFLAIGISIILDTERLGYGAKMLPTLLIVAVTLNFSIFVAEAIIDTGNLFATQFYTQINGGEPAKPTEWSLDAAKTEGISQKVLSQMGLQTIYGQAMNPENGKQVLEAGSSLVIGFMSIILFLVAAFVFFSLAFILLARFIALIFLIIFSPVGFAGLAMPKLEGMAHSWWSALFQQTITAPILMLLLYIALAVITDINFLKGFGLDSGIAEGAWTGTAKNRNIAGFAGIILSYCVAMGLLLAVTISSKKLGAFGSDTATKYAGKLTFGATALAGRHTIGRAGQGMARRLERSHIGRVPFVGRAILSGADRVAKGSFDIRGTSALKALPFGGIDAGQAQKGGYLATEKEGIKAKEEHGKRLKQTQSLRIPLTGITLRELLDTETGKKISEAAGGLITGEESGGRSAVRVTLDEFLGRPAFVGEKERQQQAEDRQTGAEAELARIGNQFDQREIDLLNVHRTEMVPVNLAVEAAKTAAEAAKQMAEAAKATGDAAAIAAADRKAADANLVFNNQQLEVQRVRGKHEREERELRTQRTDAENPQEKVIESIKKEVKELRAAPGTAYANNLERGPFGDSYINKTSAKNLKEWAKKTKEERDNDDVSAKIKKVLADEEKAKTGTAPPTPTPPPPTP